MDFGGPPTASRPSPHHDSSRSHGPRAPLALTAGECDSPSTPLSEAKEIEVLLHNADALPVHMFLSFGEGFPCCQVASQATRTDRVQMSMGNVMIFRAGRNGEILVQKNCKLRKQGYDEGSVSVVFNAGDLTCMGW